MVVNKEILIFAFRYALGRSSMAPVIVVDAIERNLESLTMSDLYFFVKEIDECERFGMGMDRELWQSFVERLRLEIDKRKNQ